MTEENRFSHGYALVVGVGNYEAEKLTVEATANDAEDINKVLMDPSLCAYPESQVQALTNSIATKENILKALDELFEQTEVDTNATVLIFFSGHGWNEKGEYYFLPYETKVILSEETGEIDGVILDTAIANSELVEKFRKMSNSRSVKRFVIFFNTCHSGGLGTALSPAKADTKLQAVPLEDYESLLQGSGRYIVSSSKGKQKSWVKHGARNSIFTEQLIAGFQGKASQEGDTEVWIMQLITFLNRAVREEAKSIREVQTPVHSAYSSEDFAIALLRGGQPLGLPDRHRPSTPPQPMTHIELADRLNKEFTIDELIQLCYELKVDHENFQQFPKFRFAQQLVTYFERRNKLAVLQEKYEEKRGD